MGIDRLPGPPDVGTVPGVGSDAGVGTVDGVGGVGVGPADVGSTAGVGELLGVGSGSLTGRSRARSRVSEQPLLLHRAAGVGNLRASVRVHFLE
jgi:hypothetical protein